MQRQSRMQHGRPVCTTAAAVHSALWGEAAPLPAAHLEAHCLGSCSITPLLLSGTVVRDQALRDASICSCAWATDLDTSPGSL